jgi:hypothetical protein
MGEVHAQTSFLGEEFSGDGIVDLISPFGSWATNVPNRTLHIPGAAREFNSLLRLVIILRYTVQVESDSFSMIF